MTETNSTTKEGTMRRAIFALMIVMAAVPATTFGQGAVLTWQDTNTIETGSSIERATGTCTTPGTWAVIGTVGPNITTFTDSAALTQGQSYCWRVRAANGTVFGPYSNLAGKTIPFTMPAAPTNLVVQ